MPPASDTPNSRPPIPILHLDEGFVAVSKPGGLLVHRTKESTDRVFLLQELRNQLGRHVFPVHRLDRGASGAMLLAFTGEDARLLQQSLESPEALKEYLVLVRGWTATQYEERLLATLLRVLTNAPAPDTSSLSKRRDDAAAQRTQQLRKQGTARPS